MNTVNYPSSKYLTDLKAELRSKECVYIQLGSGMSRRILRDPLKQVATEGGWSFQEFVKFFFFPKLLYSLLAVEARGFTSEYDGEGIFTIRRQISTRK